MSKCVLVMDMPNGCENCVMAKTRHSTDKNYCILTENNFYDDLQKRPDWCPLKPMPEKKDICGTYNSEYYANGGMMPSAKIGYNACIDELLKGEEG